MRIVKLFILVLATLQVSCIKNVSSQDSYSELFVSGVSQPIKSLNGTWELNTSPEEGFLKNQQNDTLWRNVQVPGEVMMQGHYIEHDKPFLYRKEVRIPEDYSGKNVLLEFDGVYSYARVWVNGNYVRDHHGGFTRWNCDITPYVKPGENALIFVEVTDRVDEISYGSGYAKHQIGGILRDVHLLARPMNYPVEVIVETDFDHEYRDAWLKIDGNLVKTASQSELVVQLIDSDDREISLEKDRVSFTDSNSFSIENRVVQPKKWDAEHPNLYTLTLSFYEQGELVWRKSQKVGFREIKIEGNSFLVNGKPVKLRGANRHDVHPTLGRASTPEYELKDVLLAKEANMNYIRTSHYPPTERFLRLCDEFGIYVEDETAVCFILEHRIKGYEAAGSSQSNPLFERRYLSQLEEMVDSHRNHPSVVIWSIGNESNFGSNFQKSYDWVKANDKTRPIKFSYPGTAKGSQTTPYDILSMHYQEFDGNLEQRGIQVEKYGYEKMPVIFDEWAHVACYNNETILEDPNVRDFWGQSLDSMWIRVFEADGGLGGGIWSMIDEVFMLPEDLEGFRTTWGKDDKSVEPYKGHAVGYGEWGIVDVWRRKKPEFWNTKKAYSPIRLSNINLANLNAGDQIQLPLHNRFDHTNLNEITVELTHKNKKLKLPPIDIQPHEKGILKLPITNWEYDDEIRINFFQANGNLVDTYLLSSAKSSFLEEDIENSKLTIEDTKDVLDIHTDGGIFRFDKKTGLLRELFKKGEEVFRISGPTILLQTKGKEIENRWLHEIKKYGRDWQLTSFDYKVENNKAIVFIKGDYESVSAEYVIHLSSKGQLTTRYRYEGLPGEQVSEIGVKYMFENVFDSLSWNRDAYWSSYSEDHLSSKSGKVNLYSSKQNSYRKTPHKYWIEDTKSFYYSNTKPEANDELTYISRSTKENVLEYSLYADEMECLVVKGDGKVSCRLNKSNQEELALHLINELDYVNLNWGNYERNLILDTVYEGEVRIQFNK